MASNFKETAVKTVRVKTAQLKETLRSNLEKHRREYNEAREGWIAERKEAMATLSAATAACAKESTKKTREEVRDTFHAWNNLAAPRDHSGDYEQAIALMEWETRDEIDLSINDFECYVRDNWNWQREFKMSHANYSNRASS